MNKKIVTGIDVGTGTVRIAVCEYSPGLKFPRVLALVKKESQGVRRGYVVNPDEATENIRSAIKEARAASKAKIKNVFASIGGISLESKTAEGEVILARGMSEITEADVRHAIAASEANFDTANRRIIHSIPLSFKVDGRKIPARPQGFRAARLEARTLFISCFSQHLSDLVTAIEEAGVGVEDIVASPIAASLVTLTKLQKAAGCVLANIGSQTTSIVVFEEGIPQSLQVFPVGSSDITNDIALGLKVPIEDAERLKLSEHEVPSLKRKLDEIITARLSDIFDFIESHLKKIGRSALLPAGIVITGGGSAVPQIEDLAKNYLKLPARSASLSLQDHSKNQVRDPAWAVAYGLSVFGSQFEEESVLGVKIVERTGSQIFKWLRELLP